LSKERISDDTLERLFDLVELGEDPRRAAALSLFPSPFRFDGAVQHDFDCRARFKDKILAPRKQHCAGPDGGATSATDRCAFAAIRDAANQRSACSCCANGLCIFTLAGIALDRRFALSLT